MKNNKLIQNIIAFLIACVPFLYMAFIWSDMPDRVPLHFGADGTPDRFGEKKELLAPLSILAIVGIGIYFLIQNTHKIDPKRVGSSESFSKWGLTILFFLSSLSTYIVHTTLIGSVGNGLFVLLGLLFAALGNLMHSVKPNYFIGMRLPWTLENEDNWRKTHQLASKIWFAGGLSLAFIAIFLAPKAMFIIFLVTIMFLTVIPIVYSYREFRREAQSNN